MKLKFDYDKSLAEQPENCDVDFVDVLSDVIAKR